MQIDLTPRHISLRHSSFCGASPLSHSRQISLSGTTRPFGEFSSCERNGVLIPLPNCYLDLRLTSGEDVPQNLGLLSWWEAKRDELTGELSEESLYGEILLTDAPFGNLWNLMQGVAATEFHVELHIKVPSKKKFVADLETIYVLDGKEWQISSLSITRVSPL